MTEKQAILAFIYFLEERDNPVRIGGGAPPNHILNVAGDYFKLQGFGSVPNDYHKYVNDTLHSSAVPAEVSSKDTMTFKMSGEEVTFTPDDNPAGEEKTIEALEKQAEIKEEVGRAMEAEEKNIRAGEIAEKVAEEVFGKTPGFEQSEDEYTKEEFEADKKEMENKNRPSYNETPEERKAEHEFEEAQRKADFQEAAQEAHFDDIAQGLVEPTPEEAKFFEEREAKYGEAKTD